MAIVEIEVSRVGPPGALDMSTVSLATGAPGSDVTYDDGVLTIPRGNDGGVGPRGEKGDKGDRGDQGPKGDAGDQGPIGETGAQGPKGDRGDPGAAGATGAKGDTGATGTSVTVRHYTDLAAAQAAAITYPNDIITYKPAGA